MNRSLIPFAVAGALGLLATAGANAAVVVDSLETVACPTCSKGVGSSVDYWWVTIAASGYQLRIDVAAYEDDQRDPLQNKTVDLTGEGRSTVMDSRMYWFRDEDGLKSTRDWTLVTENDDSGNPGYDGTVDTQDPYIQRTNAAGSWVLAYGLYSLSESEATAGVGAIGLVDFQECPVGPDVLDCNLEESADANYRLSISSHDKVTGVEIAGNVTLEAIAPAPIPLPAALPLMLSALGGLALVGRRRRRA